MDSLIIDCLSHGTLSECYEVRSQFPTLSSFAAGFHSVNSMNTIFYSQYPYSPHLFGCLVL